MTDYRDFMREALRLAVLRLLEGSVNYEAGETLLGMALGPMGHHPSRDTLRAELAWLADQGALQLREIGTEQIATLLVRGMDVASGRARMPGVARPKPGG